MADPIDLFQCLESLGKTEDEVAEKLLTSDCKGMPHCGNLCPVAMYLRKRGYKRVMILEKYGMAGDKYCRLPPQVSIFVQDFDAGIYPDLYDRTALYEPPVRQGLYTQDEGGG